MCLLATGVALVCLARLWFGVDYTDEAFYSAVPYRFVLGDRPFVDELHVTQFAGLLTYPLVRVYTAVVSTSGLILALRLVYFVFVFGIAVASLACLRRIVRWPWLLAGGLAYLSLVPFSLPTLSYNTLAAGFLSYGVILGIAHMLGSGRAWLMFAAGLCHALAIAAYPTLLIVAPVFALALWKAKPKSARRSLILYTAGLAVALVPYAVVLRAFGIHNILNVYSFNSQVHGFGGLSKIAALYRSAIGWAASVAVAVPLVAGVVIAGTRRPVLRRRFLALVPFAGLCLLLTRTPPVTWAVSYLILLGVWSWLTVLYDIDPAEAAKRCLILWGLIPATVAAAVTSYSSTNGFLAAWVGCAPMIMVGCVAASLSWPPHSALRRSWNASRLRSAPLICAIVLGLVFQWFAVYRDAPVWHLTSRVREGPYLGMLTTQTRQMLLQNLSTDIREFSTPSDTVLFYPLFSAGYLFSSMRPATPTVWQFDVPADPTTQAWYADKKRFPSLLFLFPDTTHTKKPMPPSLGDVKYKLIGVRSSYLVFRGRSGSPSP